jgi:hypothetical protein
MGIAEGRRTEAVALLQKPLICGVATRVLGIHDEKERWPTP